MKPFLETWLTTFPEILQREFSSRAELVPAHNLLPAATAVSLAISIGSNAGEQFVVATELPVLHALLVEAGLAESEPDSVRDYELWRGLLKEVTTAAARNFGEVEEALVEDAPWPTAPSSLDYELRLGDVKMHLAFTTDAGSRATSRTPEAKEIAAKAETQPKDGRPGIDLLLDVELEASLRFGSCEMSLNEVLELGPGDVVELDRHVTDPVDLLVGDKIVARGEVVLVNGSFGLRVLEIAEPRKCLESVRCLF